MAEESQELPAIREFLPGWPKSLQPIFSEHDMQSGTHIIFNITSPPLRAIFQSALVTNVHMNGHIEIIMNCANKGGVVKKSFLLSIFLKQEVYKITYVAPLYDSRRAIERAESRLNERCYHVLKNNSHFFMTWCITGREQALTDILRALEDSHQDHLESEEGLKMGKDGLKPIFYQIPIPSCQNLKCGDHILLTDFSQHYLVESVSHVDNKFSAYTLDEDNNVQLVHDILISPRMLWIELDHVPKMPSKSPEQILRRAQECISSEWISSEYFITKMKYGTGCLFDNIQCFVLESEIAFEFVCITPEVKIAVGDHLMIRDHRNPEYFHSGIVYSCPDHTRVKILPQLGLTDVLDVTLLPEVYRVEYSSFLPCDETLLRAKSKQGEEILKGNPNDYSIFVNWAKTGQTKCIPPGDAIMNDKSYEKVTHCNQIQKGDHLIQLKHPEEYPDGLRHLLVTECAGESKHKVLFCKRNYLREQVKELKGEVYIVRCQHDEGLMPEDIVERGRKQIGQKYNPSDRMLFIMQAKSHQSEETSVPAAEKLTVSRVLPCSRSRIMCFNQVSPGDYIIKEPTMSNKTIDTYHHYLVVSVHGSPTHCQAIESDSGNIKRVHCIVEADIEQASYVYYRINYELGTCIPAEKSITSAQELVGKQSHIGSDRFVHYIKTGNVMKVILNELQDERDHVQQVRISLNHNAPVLGNPVEYHRITTTDKKIPIGTHILYKVNDTFPPSYRSALVIGTQQNQSDSNEMTLEFITNTMKDGIIKQSAEIKDLQNLSKVIYLSAGNSAEDAVTTAREHLKYTENFFHLEFYNSHHFVTMCVTGREYSLVDILAGIENEECQGNHDKHLKPILFKVEVNSLDDINPADHVVIEGQHYLVGSKNVDNGKFSVYTIDKPMSHFMKRTVRMGKCIRIDYCVYGNELIEPSLVLERAEKMLSESNDWSKKSSEGFVSKMKCGAEYYFDDRCLMSDNVKILSLTKVTPHISIEEGNHLVLLRNGMAHLQYQSVLVCKCIDSRTIDIISPVDVTSTTTTSMIIEQKEIDICDHTVYRVNYSQSLPSDCVLERARSKVGEGIIATCANPHRFITWAKTGKMLDMPEEFPEKSDLKIADVRPLRYEKIMSPDEIQIGDHLFTTTVINFIDREIRKNHFLVTDRIADVINPVFKVIYLSAGLHLKEAEHEFNPHILEENTQVYRVVYPEAFPCQLSIKRLRSQFKHQHFPTCAASLIRWAKTGSQEGLEANFLTDSSLPTSKSQLACFTQLNPGDYVVKMSQFNHHYLVISVESPTECRVIESWRRKVEEKVITCNNWPNESTYFRINYDPGQCINAEQSIKMARDMCTNPNFFSRYWNPKSECARESFVHFVKTGGRSLNIENLQDDRLFLQREVIKSAFDLCIGDHIERPLSIAPTGDVKHHMLVVKPVSPTTCLVIHYKVEKSATRTQKGDIICEVVDIFEHGDVFRIFYPERTDPKDGIGKLASKLSKEDRERLQNEIRALAIELSNVDDQGKARLQSEIEYHLKNNNCEHLIMFATIGIPMSIQVDKIIHHALCCTKRSLRAFRGSLVHRGAKCTPNELMHMSMVCKHGALAMAGGIEFAISVAVEVPILMYNIRQLKIKEKFGVISEEEFKRHVLKEVLVGCGVVAGGTAGTIAGQATIPVPVLGAVIGGMLGGLLGQGSGTLLATLLGRYLIQEKKLTLPKILSYSYNSLLEY